MGFQRAGNHSDGRMAQENKIVADAAPKDGPSADAASSAAEPQRASFIPMASKGPATPPPVPPPVPESKGQPKPPPAAKTPDDELRVPPRVLAPAAEAPARRSARRRPAGASRGHVAANDDTPSIGGLIYALEQKPSNKPFVFAGIASAVWVAIAAVFLWSIVGAELGEGGTIGGLLTKPTAFLTLASIVVPIAVLWFLALLVWRSEELRLRSSTMTEVAVRLAEPDRMAEQSVASLGQAVRRQVAFMNDAVSRALGRAGELEALVHNEVSALERSYEENERKIRSLIQELAGERQAIVNTSGQVSETLRQLGTDIPGLIEKLSSQQVKLAHIIQGAGENLTALETAVGQSATRLETTLGMRTDELQGVLEGYTTALGTALGSRTEQIQGVLESYTMALGSALDSRTVQIDAMLQTHSSALTENLGNRSEQLQAVFEEYARALDTSFSNQAQAFDTQLVERTRALDGAFSERLRLFDESIKSSVTAIDHAVSDKALALTSALDSHAHNFSETIKRQTSEIDDSLMQGISAVRRTSENITRQSLKAIEGLAGQSEVLRNVSENLLGQIHTITNRFENQSQGIMRAANSLESINYKIDQTLQARHAELSTTLDRMSGKADEFGRFVEGYSTTIAGSLTDAETRARAVAHEIILGAEKTKRAALADLERFRSEADAQGERALDELRRRFSSVSHAVSEELDTLSNRFDATTEEVRLKSQKAASEIAAEQAWLREQMERLPVATRESADAMRRALQDQLKALEQLSSLTTRTAQSRDVTPPLGLPPVRSQAAPLAQSEARRPEPAYPDRSPPTQPAPPAPAVQAPEPPRALPPRQLPHAPAALPPRPQAAAAAQDTSAWSLGDLLARASRDEEHHGQPAQPPPQPKPAIQATPPVPAEVKPGAPYQLNVDVIARALDPATTSAIWNRLRAGQRGVMVRGAYSPEGRAVFDEVSRRIHSDPDLARTVNRYLGDFERIQREAEAKDPSGRLVQNHLVSDTGRVYLFLAHASGRLA